MPQPVPVRIGETEFFLEVDGGGPAQVGAKQAQTFDAVRETMHAVANEFAKVWEAVRPDEATVEFGLSATARTGRLTGLLVDGGGDATFKVTMTWRPSSPAERSAEDPDHAAAAAGPAAGGEPTTEAAEPVERSQTGEE